MDSQANGNLILQASSELSEIGVASDASSKRAASRGVKQLAMALQARQPSATPSVHSSGSATPRSATPRSAKPKSASSIYAPSVIGSQLNIGRLNSGIVPASTTGPWQNYALHASSALKQNLDAASAVSSTRSAAASSSSSLSRQQSLRTAPARLQDTKQVWQGRAGSRDDWQRSSPRTPRGGVRPDAAHSMAVPDKLEGPAHPGEGYAEVFQGAAGERSWSNTPRLKANRGWSVHHGGAGGGGGETQRRLYKATFGEDSYVSGRRTGHHLNIGFTSSQVKSVLQPTAAGASGDMTSLLYASSRDADSSARDISSLSDGLAGKPLFSVTERNRKQTQPPFVSAAQDAMTHRGGDELLLSGVMKGESVPHRPPRNHVPDASFQEAAGLLSARSHRGLAVTLERRQMEFHAGDPVLGDLTPRQTPRLERSRSADPAAAKRSRSADPSVASSEGTSRIGIRPQGHADGYRFPLHPRVNQNSLSKPKSTPALGMSVPAPRSAGVPLSQLNARLLSAGTVFTKADEYSSQPVMPGSPRMPAGRPSSRGPPSLQSWQHGPTPPWMRDDNDERLSELRHVHGPALTAR